MSDVVFLVLLVAHVGSIVAWMGGAALFISVVTPSIRRMSPTSRNEFVLSVLPPYMRFIGGSSIISVTAGVALYAYITQIATSLAPTSSGLIYIQAGAVLGLVVLLLAFAVIIPTGRKLVRILKLGQKQPTPDVDPMAAVQMASLQKRLAMGARIGVSLLTLTLVLMILGASI